jgi:hypothetical protein
MTLLVSVIEGPFSTAHLFFCDDAKLNAGPTRYLILNTLFKYRLHIVSTNKTFIGHPRIKQVGIGRELNSPSSVLASGASGFLARTLEINLGFT